jgi:anaphase-promoting complex subunit 10
MASSAAATEDEDGLCEIGHLASWSVTSAKPGNGVELLRDGDPATFWQCVVLLCERM